MNTLQSQVIELNCANAFAIDTKLRALDLSSEVGEVCKLAFAEGTGQQIPKEKWKEELGDTLYSLLSLLTDLGIDADQALSVVLTKYQSRISRHGSSHSGS